MSLWFRAYCDALDNVKIQTLEPELFKAWFNLMAVAKIYNGRIPNLQTVAFRLRVDTTKARHYVDTLSSADVRLLDSRPDGSWVPHDWEDWQYPSDSSTDRVQKFRAKAKQETKQSDDPSPKHAETFLERSRNGIEKSREEKRREEQTTTTAAPFAPAPVPSYSEFPLVAAAVREQFPTADDELLMALLQKCSQESLSINGAAKCVLSDSLVADAVREARAKTPRQNSAGLYLKTVPQVVKTWMVQGHPRDRSAASVDKFASLRPKPWKCIDCGMDNPATVDDCRGRDCKATRPQIQQEASAR